MSERSQAFYIGIDGEWILNIKLSSSSSVCMNSLEQFTIIEETGNTLPTWQTSFIATPDLEPEWVESLKLPVILSKAMDDPEKLSTTLLILHPDTQDFAQGLKRYTATGVLYAPAFTQTPYLTTSKSCNGTDVLQHIAKKHFNELDTSRMTPSSEQQPWYQSNITDRKFADFVSSHCYIPNSFVGTGITSSGKYVIVDVVKISNMSEDYTVTHNPKTQKDLLMYQFPKNIDRSGFMNSVATYGMDTPIISQEGGIRTVHRPQITFGFTDNKHPEIENVQRKTLAPVKCNINSDPKSYMAKANFDYGQALLSTETIQVTVEAPYFPIKIWDIVKLVYPDSEATGGLNNNYSGKYTVSKVIRTISHNNLFTTLMLNRDAHNMTSSN